MEPEHSKIAPAPIVRTLHELRGRHDDTPAPWDDPADECLPWYTGWELLNERGYRREMLINTLPGRGLPMLLSGSALPAMFNIGEMIVRVDDSRPLQTAAERLPAAFVERVDRINRQQEAVSSVKKGSVEPAWIDEAHEAVDYAVNNWSNRDARKLPNNYQVYEAPGCPAGQTLPPGIKSNRIIILKQRDAIERVIVAALDPDGKILWQCDRRVIRDYLVATRKYVKAMRRQGTPSNVLSVASVA